MPSSDFCGYRAHMLHSHIYKQNTHFNYQTKKVRTFEKLSPAGLLTIRESCDLKAQKLILPLVINFSYQLYHFLSYDLKDFCRVFVLFCQTALYNSEIIFIRYTLLHSSIKKKRQQYTHQCSVQLLRNVCSQIYHSRRQAKVMITSIQYFN